MKNSFSAFQQKLIDIAQLKSALAVLNWDKGVFMPPKGSGPRAAMLGYLAGEIHEKVLSKDFRELLREVKAAADADELSSAERAPLLYTAAGCATSCNAAAKASMA